VDERQRRGRTLDVEQHDVDARAAQLLGVTGGDAARH
jgi:hypothetical protein